MNNKKKKADRFVWLEQWRRIPKNVNILIHSNKGNGEERVVVRDHTNVAGANEFELKEPVAADAFDRRLLVSSKCLPFRPRFFRFRSSEDWNKKSSSFGGARRGQRKGQVETEGETKKTKMADEENPKRRNEEEKWEMVGGDEKWVVKILFPESKGSGPIRVEHGRRTA
jgi:hypothetical protein